MKLTYAQQEAIALKALRVCESVIRSSQIPAATNFVRLAAQPNLKLNLMMLRALSEASVRMNKKPRIRVSTNAMLL